LKQKIKVISMREVVSSKNAPKAIGPYSQAIKVGNTLYCAGQISINPETSELELADIKQQTERVLKNLKAVIKEAGFTMGDVVKTTVYLSNIKDFSGMNEVYAQFFGEGKPARSTVAVRSLPKGAKVEIDAIAVK
jgi:2-iminobutanoate/2-iminopropanoate deaminase